jgi:predicted neutral ceramidase superfamily lipid hydrolase
LREGKKFLLREIFMRNLRYIKTALKMGSSLHRGPVGELGGGSFPGTFERKR